MDIEAYRKRKKMSVKELADMLWVTEAAIYNYKYGRSKPSYESVEKMLLDGAFLSEVFDDNLQAIVEQSLRKPEPDGMHPMTKDEIIALFRLMKANGEI